MSSLTITAKGQITLRKDLLNHLGLQPGDKINVDRLPDGKLEISPCRETGDISEMLGCLYQENGPVLTIEEMNEIIERGWAGEFNEDNS